MSKTDTSPVVVDDMSGNQADNQRLLDDVEKQLWQRIMAKLNHVSRTTSPDLRLCHLVSCLLRNSARNMQAAKRVGRYLRKVPSGMAGISFSAISDAECSCVSRMLTGLRTRFLDGRQAEVTSHLGGGLFGCWAEKQSSVASSSWSE